MTNCPRCGNEVSSLQTAETGSGSSQVCATCASELSTQNSPPPGGGGLLVAQEKAKEQHRLQLWKSRVGLIKKARALMSRKLYNEAAASYEKYIRILEVVFDCKKGEHLTPEMFKDSARTSELTVVTSVYWDLLRIYDSSDKYLDRQQFAAKQLASFVQFTPIFPDIIKRAEAFVKTAKHPQVIKSFLKAAAQHGSKCFIATAAFDYPMADEVQALRMFRDQHLLPSFWGKAFVSFYYFISPPLSRFLITRPRGKAAVRAFLRQLLKWLPS